MRRRGFNLSEHIACERAFCKPFIWVKNAESLLKKVYAKPSQIGEHRFPCGIGCCRLWPLWPALNGSGLVSAAFNVGDERQFRAGKGSVMEFLAVSANELSAELCQAWREPFLYSPC